MSTEVNLPVKAPSAMDVRSLIQEIHAIRKVPDYERNWNRFADLLRQLCRSRNALIINLSTAISVMGRSTGDANWAPSAETLAPDGLLQRAMQNGFSFGPAGDSENRKFLAVMVRLSGVDQAILILDVPEQERPQLNEIVLRALLAADFSISVSDQASTAPELLDMLDLSADVMQQNSFGAAALALVNGVAAKLDVQHASLGWVDGPSVEVVAISHLDRFERKGKSSQLLEEAFKETLELNHEIWWPPATPSSVQMVALDDAAKHHGFGRICSMPIRDSFGVTHAVLLMGFTEEASTEKDFTNLLLALELLQPRLTDMRRQNLSLGRRFRAWCKHQIERFLGPGHVWAKAAGVTGILFLLIATFGSWPYRIEASSQLVTDSTRILSAHFDGRVDEVFATSGDLVKEGAPLAKLDTRELAQQESEIVSELRKAEAELGKARANNNLADAEIAQARLLQSEARLTRVKYALSQASNLAPFDGVIVEGERKELLGAPVKKGDRIFRIAKTENIYAVLHIQERDVRDIGPGAEGELSLLSRPDQRIPFLITSVIPVAQVKGQEGNNFMAIAKLQHAPESWWRPGMTGSARVDVGDKNIFWILTHRIVDIVRMKFWL